DEFVAAQTRDELPAGGFEHPPARLDEQGVARRMAERVVDHFELVEIEAMQREQAAIALRRAERMLELLLEHGAVGQAREHVVKRELGDAPLALDDLARHLIEAGRQPRELVATADPNLHMLARR